MDQSTLLHLLNKLHVRTRVVRINGDQSIVGCAASQSAGTGIQSTHHLRIGWRVETSVDIAIGSSVRSLEVASLTLLISVVLDKEVPRQIGILRDPGMVGRNSVVDVIDLVVSSFDE